jgi:ABC-type nitrate/sulfonate/bicarbonate transport system ATPase subunit
LSRTSSPDCPEDEATSALDEKTRDRLLETIQKIAPKLATLMITHDPAVAEIADRVTMMESSPHHINGNTTVRILTPRAESKASSEKIVASQPIAPTYQPQRRFASVRR